MTPSPVSWFCFIVYFHLSPDWKKTKTKKSNIPKVREQFCEKEPSDPWKLKLKQSSESLWSEGTAFPYDREPPAVEGLTSLNTPSTEFEKSSRSPEEMERQQA